jgi:hypothetical protein
VSLLAVDHNKENRNGVLCESSNTFLYGTFPGSGYGSGATGRRLQFEREFNQLG